MKIVVFTDDGGFDCYITEEDNEVVLARFRIPYTFGDTRHRDRTLIRMARLMKLPVEVSVVTIDMAAFAAEQGVEITAR
jgi:hypothetical protein